MNKKTNKKDETIPEMVDDEGLTTEDLLGLKTIQVRRIASRMTRMTGTEERRPQITGEIIEEDHALEGETCKWGLVTPSVVEKVLKTGRKEGNDIILQLPEPDKDAPITWVNYL
ncbi:MAG: hypothetical protein ACXADY_02950 [Candidatus Hodarchaeales archaeon]|jgi:hypothetical protein